MSRLKRGLLAKPKFFFFSVLVFQQIVILFLLAHPCRGDAEPSQTVRTVVGADVILPCNLEPGDDAVSETLMWSRPDLEPTFIHVRPGAQNRTAQNLTDEQNPSYTGRTSVSLNRLKHGDLSLKLSAVKLSDNGTYICCFPLKDKQYSVKLVVENVKTPCDQASLNHDTTPAGEDETLHDETYLNEDQTLNTKTADSSSSICLPRVYFYAICTAVAVVFLFMFLLVVRKSSHTGRVKQSRSAEDPPPAAPEEETQGLHPVEREKRDIVSILTEHQIETIKLRNELLSELEEVSTEKEKNKESLQSVDKDLEAETGQKKQDLLNQKGNLLESKWKLDEMKTEKEKVLLQTEKLLQTINTVTNKMTGHKPG